MGDRASSAATVRPTDKSRISRLPRCRIHEVLAEACAAVKASPASLEADGDLPTWKWTFTGNMRARLSFGKRRVLVLGFFGIVVAMTLVVLTDVLPVRLPRFEDLAWHFGLLAVLLVFVLLFVMAITGTVSAAGSIARWFARRWGTGDDQWKWRWISAEGLIVGLAVAGTWLGWSPTDVYPHPEENRQIEMRQPSLLEASLVLHHGSDCFVRVTVTYRDAHGRTFVQRDCEGRQEQAVARIMNRTIRWSNSGPPRAVVILHESGNFLFFPEPIKDNHCPPEEAVEAYLRGAPAEAVQRICSAKTARNH